MDDRLRLLRYLYGEDVDEASIAQRLSEDEELFREYQRLREAKAQLDQRPVQQPDAAVVDQVVDTARTAAQESEAPVSEDRPPRSPSRTWTDRLQTASATLAVVLLVGLGWWQGRGVPEAAEAPSASALGETAQRAGPAAAQNLGADAVPAWDDSDELVRIHRQLERLRAHSTPDRWGSTLQPVGRR